jgi:hypothetical protein
MLMLDQIVRKIKLSIGETYFFFYFMRQFAGETVVEKRNKASRDISRQLNRSTTKKTAK